MNPLHMMPHSMTTQTIWLLGIALFAVGVFGLLARGELIGRLIAIEIAFNGVALAAFAALAGHGVAGGGTLVLFAIAVTVSEIAIALAVWMLGRSAGAPTDPDQSRELAAQEEQA